MLILTSDVARTPHLRALPAAERSVRAIGENIHLGARTFVNYNLTALDVATVTIGDVPAGVVAVGNPARHLYCGQQ